MSLADDRQAIKEWDAHVKAIRQHTHVDVREELVAKEKRIAKLEQNIEAWCKYYFPHYIQCDFADFHRRYFKDVLSSPKLYVVREWARDHAKSVTTEVLLGLYLAMTGRKKNFLLASYNETKAIDLLIPVRLELESNQRLINDYGLQKSFNQWEAGKFVTRNGVSFRAIGSGQSPRGAREQEARPDCIICDDIDEDELCRNPQRLDQAWEWLSGALFGCFSIAGDNLFLVVGNRIAKDSMLVRATAQADSYEQVNILTENGEPSWKERFTLEMCKYMIEKMGYRLSQREYFNNPLSEGKVFKKDWMVFKELPPLRDYTCLIAYLDPGFKKTKTSDTKSWIMVGLWKGKYHIRKVFCALASVNEMIGWGYEMDAYAKMKNASCQLKMEEVFLQDLLYKDFSEVGRTRGFTLPVSGDKRKKPDKDARIVAMSSHFERGNVYFDKEIEADHHTIAFVEQLTGFEPGVKCRKDGPDACEGAIFLLQQMIAGQNEIYAGGKPVNENRL